MEETETKIIDGRRLSSIILSDLKNQIRLEQSSTYPSLLGNSIIARNLKTSERPVLGYIIVGGRIDSEMYVRLKKKACEEVGIDYFGFELKESAT